MAETDIAVKRDGKRYRLVTNGDKAGIFDNTGLVETVHVTVPATAPTRMPEVESGIGERISLSRSTRPCACGFPWNASAKTLRDSIV